MKFRTVTGSALQADADLIALCVSGAPDKDPSFKAANTALGGVLTQMAKEERFTGKVGQTLVAQTYGDIPAARVALIGAGPKGEQADADVRNLAAVAAKLARSKGAKKLCFVVPATGRKGDAALQYAAEGAILGSYKFTKYKKKSGGEHAVQTVLVAADVGGRKKPGKGASAALKRGQAVAEAVCRARDYVNEPAEAMTPTQLATEARALARKHASIKVKVMGAKECEKAGMGLFLGVGRGSAQESQFIHLTYTPKKKATKRVALIGKGVTFDSGGYSIKPSAGMEDMKIDMSGAAAVIAAMDAIATIGSSCEVHAVTAACENMVSGNAYKLGDVLVGMDGTTVEINNTDAEGRLTLGDAIAYTRTKIKPDEMFDFATLTGACMVALGPHTAGVMSNDDALVKRWLAAAGEAGEDMWQLPLNPRLREQLKSNIAQMRNTGERWGGAITAGLFLQSFVKDVPWVHVDLAGPASTSREQGATTRGGTGFAVATICEYLTR